MNDPDKLDRILRRDSQQPIDDGGFGTRVMAALPARAAGERTWMKSALVVGSVALGSLLAWFFAPPGAGAVQGILDLAQLRGLTPAAVTSLATGAALLFCAIVLAVSAE
jgi:hypothetical protein